MSRRRTPPMALLDPQGDATGDPPDRDAELDARAPKEPLPGQGEPELDDEDLEDDGLTPDERDEIARASEEADEEAEAKQAAAEHTANEDAGAAAAAVATDEDDDVSAVHPYTKAKHNLAMMRRWATRADLYRVEPKEYKGQQISGFIRRFEGNFDLSDIQLWTRRNRGRGEYQILIYDGKGILRRRKDFACEGRIILADEAPGEDDVLAQRQHDQRAQAPAGEDRAGALERQLQEERFERRLAEQQASTNMMFERLTTSIEKMAEKVAVKPPEAPKTDMLALVTAVSPMITGLLNNQAAAATAMRAAATEAAKAQADAQQKQTELLMNMQEKAETRMSKLVTELRPKQESFAEMLKSGAEFKKFLGVDSDPTKIIRDTVPALLKTHMDMLAKIELHKAGVTGGGKEESLGEKIVNSLTGLAEDILPQIMTKQPQPVAPYGGTPQQPAALPGPTAAPAPVQPPQAGSRAGGQIVTPEQQAAHEQAELAARAAKKAAAPVVGAPPGPPPAAPAVVEATPIPAAPPTPQAQALEVMLSYGISPRVFEIGLRYLAEGKGGDDLAADCAEEEEAHHKAQPNTFLNFSPSFLTYISRRAPEEVLGKLMPFLQPIEAAAPLLTPVGQAFLTDFCRFFSDPVDEEGGEEEAVA